MTSAILKWLVGAGVAALLAGLNVLAAKLGVAPIGVDSALGMILVAVAVKLVSWIVSKVPAGD